MKRTGHKLEKIEKLQDNENTIHLKRDSPVIRPTTSEERTYSKRMFTLNNIVIRCLIVEKICHYK